MIALGCDHGGYPLMQEVIHYLQQQNIPYENFGTYSEESCDYPVYAKKWRTLWQRENVKKEF